MFDIKDFNKWNIDKNSNKFGSGASEKIWLISNDENMRGIFKYPKIKKRYDFNRRILC